MAAQQPVHGEALLATSTDVVETSATTQQDEEELIERARALDSDAWSTLYERHHAKIYRYMLIQTNNSAVAEDLAAEVFLRAVRSIGGFQFRGFSLAPWLYRIGHHVAIDHFRRAPRPTVEITEMPSQRNDGDPEEALARSQDVAELRQALRQLHEEQRQVLLLRFVQGLSTHEVAESIGKSDQAVKALQYRALNGLRRLLRDDGSTS